MNATIEWTKPADLGLPFADFRGSQIVALSELEAMEDGPKVVLVQAPTGAGKAGIAAAAGRLWNTTTSYTASTKDLQDQFCRTFPEAVMLKGRSNYPTARFAGDFPDVTCDDCQGKECTLCRDPGKRNRCRYCHGDGCAACWPSRSDVCPYLLAKQRALEAPFAVLNLAYFLRESNHAGQFSREGLLVLDEGDLTENALLGYMEVRIAERTMKGAGITPPQHKDPKADTRLLEWVPWFWASEERLRERARTLAGQASQATGLVERVRIERRVRTLQSLAGSFERLAVDLAEDPEAWVRIDDKQALVFRPVRVNQDAERLLFRHAKRVLVLSATLSPDQFCDEVGLDRAAIGWVDLPSEFPVENRRVYYKPVAPVTHKHPESVPLVVKALDDLLDRYPERVLVHTHSYQLAGDVLKLSRHAARMVTYRDAAGRAIALRQYLQSAGRVMVAPSFERGLDLAGDQCRCTVVLKVPYANLGDRQVSARVHTRGGWAWYRSQAIRSLCQMTGRGVRHEEDWADTWILDAEFGRLWNDASHLFPSSWKEGLVNDQGRVAKAWRREMGRGTVAST